MQYDLRKPIVEDRVSIHELFAITIKDNFKAENVIDPLDKMVNQEIKALQNNLDLYFETSKPKDFFLIACSKNKPVGTIAYGSVSKLISDNFKIDNSNTPEIKSVYILPNYQGKGIGTLLFQQTLSSLSEKNIKYFCLDSGYKNAQKYWQKRLGAPQCILNNYWSEGSHHMIWHCQVAKTLSAIQDQQ